MRHVPLAVLSASLVGALAVGRGLARQPDPAAPAQEEPGAGLIVDEGSAWRADARLWIWVMGVEGTVGARGLESEVSADFLDILEASDSLFAFSGRLEVGYGSWGAFLDGMYANIGAEDQTGPLGRANIDVTMEQAILDFGVMYRILEREPAAAGPAANPRDLSIDLYAGGRLSAVEISVDPARRVERSSDQTWVDPIIGARAFLPIAEDWHAEINADIGGFGAASDLTWSATAVLGYDFRLFDRPASALFGYRLIGWDYGDGRGRDEFTWDVVQHGILLGLEIWW